MRRFIAPKPTVAIGSNRQRVDVKTLRNLLLNLALLLASTAVGGLLVLWALPHLRPAPEPLPDYQDLVIFEPDLPGGQLRANVDEMVQGERAGQAVHWRTDGNGFRVDHNPTSRPAAGVIRILLLGDSYIDGMRTDQRDTLGAVLQNALGPRFEVISVGHNNPANAWYWLQQHSAAWHPDAVVLGLTLGNDLTYQNLGAGMRASSDGIEQVDRNLLDGNPAWPATPLPPAAYVPTSALALRWNRIEFHARHWLAARADFLGQLPSPETGPSNNAPGRMYDRDMYTGIGLFARERSAFIDESYRANRTTLTGIQHLLRERNVAFTLLVLPVRFQISAADWAKFQREYALNPAAFDLRAPNVELHTSCTTLEMDCVDPTDAMAARDAAGDGPFYRPRGDMHLNEAGNRLVAELLAQHLFSAQEASN
jgi:hypothetical protein